MSRRANVGVLHRRLPLRVGTDCIPHAPSDRLLPPKDLRRAATILGAGRGSLQFRRREWFETGSSVEDRMARQSLGDYPVQFRLFRGWRIFRSVAWPASFEENLAKVRTKNNVVPWARSLRARR